MLAAALGRRGLEGDEGSIGIPHGHVRSAQEDLDRFTEGGAADDGDLGARDQAEFAEAGEAGFGGQETSDDGGTSNGKGGQGFGMRLHKGWWEESETLSQKAGAGKGEFGVFEGGAVGISISRAWRGGGMIHRWTKGAGPLRNEVHEIPTHFLCCGGSVCCGRCAFGACG